MVDSSSVIVFRVTGRASEPSSSDFERAIDVELQAAGERDSGDAHLYSGGSENLEKLQRMSPILSKEIERKILMMLPPDPEMVVDADVQFRAGSVVLIATVAILNWAGSVALESFRAQLSEIVGVAVQRVVNRTLARVAPNLSPMECSVAEQSAPAGRMTTRRPALTGPWTLPSGNAWFNLLVVGLFLIVLLLFLDQVFSIGAEGGSQRWGQIGGSTPGVAQ